MTSSAGPRTPKDTRRIFEIVFVILGLAALVGLVVWLNFLLDGFTF